MSVAQMIEIPANRRPIIDIPRKAPEGPVVLAFTPIGGPQKAAIQSAKRKPLSSFIGSLPGFLGGDGVSYQRQLRDEWND